MIRYGRYNTAVRSAKDGAREHEQVDIDGAPEACGMVLSLVHDVCKGPAPEFTGADAVYSEIAWKAGYDTFTEGTDAQGSSHGDYLAGLLSVIHTLKVPTYIVCGRREERLLHPHESKPIKFVYHGAPAILSAWYTSIADGITTDIESLEHMLASCNTILDPCCGFGNTMLRALKREKECIMADVDPECVEYVRKLAREAQGMTPPTPRKGSLGGVPATSGRYAIMR